MNLTMFPLWLRQFVLAVALAVMPLHGIVTALSVLLCHRDAQSHTSHAALEHADHEPMGAHTHGATGRGEDKSNDILIYLCCNLTAAAPVAAVVTFYLPGLPIRVFQPDPLHDSFVPDRPQRPPLV